MSSIRLRIAFVLLALLVAAPSLHADDAAAPAGALTARSFEIHYKDVEKAAAMIKPLLSEDGSYSVQPSKNALVVTDTEENLDKIAGALAKYDAPPRHFVLKLTLVAASRSDSPAPVPDDLREISRKLSGVLRYNSFEKLGGITAQGKEGDDVVLDFDPGYRATFHFGEYDPVTGTVRLDGFRLDRVQPSSSDGGDSVMRTSLNLKIGQTIVVGASRKPTATRALMLVLVASEN